MTDDYASAYLHQLRYGPNPPPKRIDKAMTNGEVRIIVPADPGKVAAYRRHKRAVMKRRSNAGLKEVNDTIWGMRNGN